MKVVPSPYAIAIDTREQRPFNFSQPLRVSPRLTYSLRTQRTTLQSGDYSIIGLENRVAIERKSLADLYGTLGAGRARFTREIERLASYDVSFVLVEAELSTVLGAPPDRSKLSPLSVYRTVVSWSVRYPTRWWFAPGREAAEATAALLLEWSWRKYGNHDVPATAAAAAQLRP